MEKGFTLIELIIVVAIIIGFMGVSAFGLLRYQESVEGAGEVRELIGDLRYAKQMSIAEQIHYGVVFNFTENRYQVVKYTEDTEVIKEKGMTDDINLKNVDQYSEARFTRFGAVFRSGEIIIERDNVIKTIKIKPSGFIHVERDNIN